MLAFFIGKNRESTEKSMSKKITQTQTKTREKLNACDDQS